MFRRIRTSILVGQRGSVRLADGYRHFVAASASMGPDLNAARLLQDASDLQLKSVRIEFCKLFQPRVRREGSEY